MANAAAIDEMVVKMTEDLDIKSHISHDVLMGNSERYKSKLKSKTKDLKDLLDIMNSEKGAGFENDFLKTSNEFLDTLNAIYKMHAVFVKQCRPKPNTSITDPLDIHSKGWFNGILKHLDTHNHYLRAQKQKSTSHQLAFISHGTRNSRYDTKFSDSLPHCYLPPRN